MDGVDDILEGWFVVGDNVHKFSHDFINLFTNPNINYTDIEEEDKKMQKKTRIETLQ